MKAKHSKKISKHEEIDTIIGSQLLEAPPDQTKNDLPEGTRQILIVNTHSILNQNFVQPAPSRKPGSQSIVVLRGRPSPSSDPLLKQAWISIVEGGTPINPPIYSKATGTIYLYLPQFMLPAILAQLHEPELYCWIRHFTGGYIHGEIQTNHPASSKEL